MSSSLICSLWQSRIAATVTLVAPDRKADRQLKPAGHALDRSRDTGVSSTRVGALAAKEPSPRPEQPDGGESPVAESPLAGSPDSPMARRGDDIDDEGDLHQMQRARGNEVPAQQKEQTWYEWLLKPRPPPPLPWERCREDMIRKWISDKRKYPVVRGLFSGAHKGLSSLDLFQSESACPNSAHDE